MKYFFTLFFIIISSITHSLESFEVYEVPVSLEDEIALGSYHLENESLSATIAVAQGLIGLGTIAWSIVDQGRPVSTLSFITPISVIPNVKGKAASDIFKGIENWSAPQFHKFRAEHRDEKGRVSASFDYIIHYQHSGKYQKRGDYITGLTVAARNIHLPWRANLRANSSLISISNRGTKEAPLAAATIQVEFVLSKGATQISDTIIHHITGDGVITKL